MLKELGLVIIKSMHTLTIICYIGGKLSMRLLFTYVSLQIQTAEHHSDDEVMDDKKTDLVRNTKEFLLRFSVIFLFSSMTEKIVHAAKNNIIHECIMRIVNDDVLHHPADSLAWRTFEFGIHLSILNQEMCTLL